jgi:hypothetical protein
MPPYAWTCFRCGQANPAGTNTCAHCGSASDMSGREIEAIRGAISPPAKDSSRSPQVAIIGVLPREERRLYVALGAVSFVAWLSGCAALFTFADNMWFWVAWPAVILAMVFGFAVRYGNHVWPFSRLFISATPARERSPLPPKT